MQVSPADTYELLTTKWGVKHHLATALIERCGGNLYNIKLALDSLALYKNLAQPLSGEFQSCVQKCLNSVKGDEPATTRCRDGLHVDRASSGRLLQYQGQK